MTSKWTIAITGSRNFSNEDLIRQVLSEFPGKNILLTGACPTGADRMAEQYAEDMEWDIVYFPARWGLDPKREYDILVSMGADIVGQIFGDSLVVVEELDERAPHSGKLLLLECSFCGGENKRTHTDLLRGRTSCLSTCRQEVAKMSPVKTLYAGYLRGAKRRELDFTLTIEEFHEAILKNCFYCGIYPQNYVKKAGAREGLSYNGIDRIDNSLGYTTKNCVTCCKFCNFAKRKGSAEEFLLWLEHVKGYGKRAAYIRNKMMIDSKPDIVLAFFETEPGREQDSKGTYMTMNLAKDANIRVEKYYV